MNFWGNFANISPSLSAMASVYIRASYQCLCNWVLLFVFWQHLFHSLYRFTLNNRHRVEVWHIGVEVRLLIRQSQRRRRVSLVDSQRRLPSWDGRSTSNQRPSSRPWRAYSRYDHGSMICSISSITLSWNEEAPLIRTPCVQGLRSVLNCTYICIITCSCIAIGTYGSVG